MSDILGFGWVFQKWPSSERFLENSSKIDFGPIPHDTDPFWKPSPCQLPQSDEFSRNLSDLATSGKLIQNISKIECKIFHGIKTSVQTEEVLMKFAWMDFPGFDRSSSGKYGWVFQDLSIRVQVQLFWQEITVFNAVICYKNWYIQCPLKNWHRTLK